MYHVITRICYLVLIILSVSCNSGGSGAKSEGEIGSDDNTDTTETGLNLTGTVIMSQPVVSKLEFEIFKIGFQGSVNSLPDEIINLDSQPLTADFVTSPSLASSNELVSGYSTFAIEISRAINFVPINPPVGVGNCQDGVESIHYLGFSGSDAEMASAIASANTIEFNRGNDWKNWWDTRLIEDPSTLLGPNSDRLALYFRNHDPYSISRWDRSLDLARSNFGMSSMILHSSSTRGFPKGAVFNGPDQSRGKIVFTFLDPANAIDNSVPGACLLRNFMISLEAQ